MPATPTWIPKEPTVEGYRTMFQAAQTPVLRWFLNSLLAATGQAILILVVASHGRLRAGPDGVPRARGCSPR